MPLSPATRADIQGETQKSLLRHNEGFFGISESEGRLGTWYIAIVVPLPDAEEKIRRIAQDAHSHTRTHCNAR
jgi:hypothetical protein